MSAFLYLYFCVFPYKLIEGLLRFLCATSYKFFDGLQHQSPLHTHVPMFRPFLLLAPNVAKRGVLKWQFRATPASPSSAVRPADFRRPSCEAGAVTHGGPSSRYRQSQSLEVRLAALDRDVELLAFCPCCCSSAARLEVLWYLGSDHVRRFKVSQTGDGRGGGVPTNFGWAPILYQIQSFVDSSDIF